MTGLVPRRAILLLGIAAPAVAQPGAEQRARAFMAAYLAPLQRDGARPFDFQPWMTAELFGLWRRAVARGTRRGGFPDADPILNAQDYERPGDLRVEAVDGDAVRLSLRVFAHNPERTVLSLLWAQEGGTLRIRDVLHHAPGALPASLRRRIQAYLAGRG